MKEPSRKKNVQTTLDSVLYKPRLKLSLKLAMNISFGCLQEHEEKEEQ